MVRANTQCFLQMISYTITEHHPQTISDSKGHLGLVIQECSSGWEIVHQSVLDYMPKQSRRVDQLIADAAA